MMPAANGCVAGVLLLLLLTACAPAPDFPPPAGPPGPVSLQFVSPDYYSRTLRPGPANGRTMPVKAEPAASKEPEPETVAPIVEIPEDLDDRLRGIQERVRKLRERLNKPRPSTSDPPT